MIKYKLQSCPEHTVFFILRQGHFNFANLTTCVLSIISIVHPVLVLSIKIILYQQLFRAASMNVSGDSYGNKYRGNKYNMLGIIVKYLALYTLQQQQKVFAHVHMKRYFVRCMSLVTMTTIMIITLNTKTMHDNNDLFIYMLVVIIDEK